MKAQDIKPTPGNILVKKLPDDLATKSGIILPSAMIANKQYIYVEVVSVGEDAPKMRIEVKPGDKGIMFGRGIYDMIHIDGEDYTIVKQVDIPLVLEG